MNLNVSTIASALKQPYYGEDFLVTRVACDSREVKEYTLFAAIVGEKNDGHQYIRALDQQFGQLVFLTTKPLEFLPRNPVFMVPDIRYALGQLARAHLTALPAKIVGVTGSVGKTTTKNFILAALAPSMQASGTKANQNNELGVPLTALAVKPEDRAAVIEMGMRGLGQITYLTQFVRPDIALITNIGVSHLALLGSRENIARTKLELVDTMKPGGIAVLNGDEPLLYQARLQKKCYYFGLCAHNDYRAEKVEGSSFILCYPGGSIAVSLQLEGMHQIQNALAAFAVGHLLGCTPQKLKKGLESFTGDGSRQAFFPLRDFTVLDDSYNASPDSMRAALTVLASRPGRHVAVLGDMLELGDYAEQGHKEVGLLCKNLGLEMVCAVGKDARWIYENLPPEILRFYATDWQSMLPVLESQLQAGDTVLFKASHSMGFQQMVQALKERMGEINE